jgi:hypothetical protein
LDFLIEMGKCWKLKYRFTALTAENLVSISLKELRRASGSFIIELMFVQLSLAWMRGTRREVGYCHNNNNDNIATTMESFTTAV